jgi:hypothetical protein
MDFRYSKDGNVQQKNVNSSPTNYTYDGDLMTEAASDDLAWDETAGLRKAEMRPHLNTTGMDDCQGL